jgi:hypothetical protein
MVGFVRFDFEGEKRGESGQKRRIAPADPARVDGCGRQWLKQRERGPPEGQVMRWRCGDTGRALDGACARLFGAVSLAVIL